VKYRKKERKTNYILRSQMDRILQHAKEKAKELLKKTPILGKRLTDVPCSQGVYLVYEKSGKVIYVGKSKNLKTRLLGEHISGDNDCSTSNFRRKLSIKLDMPPGQAMKKWITNNCSFVWVEIEDGDLNSLTETLVIAYLRNQKDKAKLFNS